MDGIFGVLFYGLSSDDRPWSLEDEPALWSEPPVTWASCCCTWRRLAATLLRFAGGGWEKKEEAAGGWGFAAAAAASSSWQTGTRSTGQIPDAEWHPVCLSVYAPAPVFGLCRLVVGI